MKNNKLNSIDQFLLQTLIAQMGEEVSEELLDEKMMQISRGIGNRKLFRRALRNNAQK